MKKKKRTNLRIADEELMLEFICDNPVPWNVKITDYRRKDKKDKIWEDQAHLMAGSDHCVTPTHAFTRTRAAMVPHT